VVVEEVYAAGHDDLAPQHLAYLQDMANRVGFTILNPEPAFGNSAFRIRLHIPMDDPVFVARLRQRGS